MKPSDKEIENQLNAIDKRQRNLYRIYKIKSFFGLSTYGLNENNSLILISILHKNENDNFSFVIVNNIDKTDSESLNEYHKKALQIDETNYVTVFFNVSEKFGDFVIGNNIHKQLSANFIKNLRHQFKNHVEEEKYIKATEYLIKSLNRHLKKSPTNK